jgi:hypothetical protein
MKEWNEGRAEGVPGIIEKSKENRVRKQKKEMLTSK